MERISDLSPNASEAITINSGTTHIQNMQNAGIGGVKTRNLENNNQVKGG